MSNHTPEPWKFWGDKEAIVMDKPLHSKHGFIAVMACNEDVSARTSRDNAKRIVACVNACIGMVVPATEIAELKRQQDELLEAISNIATVAHCGGVCGLSSDDALVLIREATLKHWDRNSAPQHVMASITRVSNQTKGS